MVVSPLILKCTNRKQRTDEAQPQLTGIYETMHWAARVPGASECSCSWRWVYRSRWIQTDFQLSFNTIFAQYIKENQANKHLSAKPQPWSCSDYSKYWRRTNVVFHHPREGFKFKFCLKTYMERSMHEKNSVLVSFAALLMAWGSSQRLGYVTMPDIGGLEA